MNEKDVGSSFRLFQTLIRRFDKSNTENNILLPSIRKETHS